MSKKEKTFWVAIILLFLGCLAAFMLNLFKSEIDASSKEERAKSKTIRKAIEKKEHKIYFPGKYSVNFIVDEDGYWFSAALASDRDLINLIENKEVKKLRIKHSEIKAETYARLKEDSIEDLSLFRPEIDRSYMPVIAGLKSLKALTLRDSSEIDDALVEELKGPAGLEFISLRNNNHIGDAAVVHVAKTFKNLTEVDLRKVKNLTDAGIKALSDLDKLDTINLSNIELSTKMVRELAKFPALVKLEAVDCKLNDAKLKLLEKTKIKDLNINQNRITGYSLKHTLNNMKLKRLSIRDCYDLNNSDINWFKKRNPNCFLDDRRMDR